MNMTSNKPKYRFNRKDIFFAPRELFNRNDLSQYEKIVFLYLSRWTNRETSTCFPSMQMIADNCSVCKNTARKTLKLLESKNLIKIEPTFGEDRRQRRNTYTILF